MNPETAVLSVQPQEEASRRSFHSPISEQQQHSTRDDAMLLASFASIASEKSCSSREISPVVATSNMNNKSNSSSLLLSRTFPALPVLQPDKRTELVATASGTVKNVNVTDEQSRPRAISYASHEVPIRSAAFLLQLQPSSSSTRPIMTHHVHHERPLAPKATLVSKPCLKKTPTTATATSTNSTEKPPTIILRKKFSWKHYPPLEDFLIANREEYLRFSTMNYTIQQKKYNNTLTEQMIALANAEGYIFDSKDFSFVTVRDRIRCYYKSYVQSLKKRGIVVGYAARKLGIISEQDMMECAKLKAKIYVPRK